MNKKYIDFVPSDASTRRRSAGAKKTVRSTVVRKSPEKNPRATVARTKSVKASTSRMSSRVSTPAKQERPVNFGVIEDLEPNFVNTNVAKRPLSGGETGDKTKARTGGTVGARGGSAAKTSGAAEAKAKKVSAKKFSRSRKVAPAEKSVENSTRKSAIKQTMAIPHSPFINQNTVEKRPLSKNVYAKQVVAMKEVPSGPVTIISKPEKDKRAGVIIAVIITVILGAAAGTVAFLLLPK